MSQPPYPGQPSPEPPNEDRPYSGQQPPPYGQQPPYGQPPYGQQQPPASGPPADGEPSPYGQPYGAPEGFSAPPPPPKKSKVLPIVLITLAVLLVLCVGGGVAIFVVGRDKINNLAGKANETAAPGASEAPAATPSTEPSHATITVVEPKTLNGRPKLTDKQFASVTKELEKGMSEVPDATATVAALYGSVAKRNIVIVAAAAAPISDPKQELESSFAGAGLGGLKITGITTIDPGPLGGKAQCGRADEGDLRMAVCGWADDGSIGWIMSFFKSVNTAKAEFPKIRSQVEKKSS